MIDTLRVVGYIARKCLFGDFCIFYVAFHVYFGQFWKNDKVHVSCEILRFSFDAVDLVKLHVCSHELKETRLRVTSISDIIIYGPSH